MKLIIVTLALLATVGLDAQTPQKANTQYKKSCYVDKDNNGICDKYESGVCSKGSGKGLQDGTGRKNGKGNGQRCGKRDGSGCSNGGKGTNYVDANKNGVCDNKESVRK